MRIALVANALPPHSLAGVGVHTAALAAALGRTGVEVEVFVPRRITGLADLAQRREEREGWAVTWSASRAERAGPGQAAALGAFLDRERPGLVHFEDLGGVGFEAVEEARRRGLPTVFSAHDYHGASDSRTLLLPDLTPFEAGDEDAEARRDLALRHLDSLPVPGVHDGAHHGAVLRDQLDDGAWERLRALLHDSPLPQADARALEEARRGVRRRESLRRRALSACDARFATSRFLARTLSAVVGRAVDWRAAGIDPTPFAGASLVEARAGARTGGGEGAGGSPLCFGFVGSIAKHRGLHLLLDAFERLRDGASELGARLAVYGDSPDRAYVEAMSRRAAALGVGWHGSFLPHEVGRVMGAIDVLVLPSLWRDTAPFVVAEALAAGRPVIVPRTDPLLESFRPQEEGELFEPGEVGDLAATMQRFVQEPGLHERLAAAIAPVKDVDSEAREWRETYAGLLGRGARVPRGDGVSAPSARVPVHLAPFQARYDEYDSLPLRDLFSTVLAGLERLGSQMGLGADARDFLALAVGRGSRLRDGVAVEQPADPPSERDEAREAREREALERERDDLRRDRAAGDRARREQLADANRALDSLGDERQQLQDNLVESRQELEEMRLRFTSLDRELAASRADGEALEERQRSVEQELSAARAQEVRTADAIADLVRGLIPRRGQGRAARDVARTLDQGRAELERVLSELAWRREEMEAASRESESLRARLAGGELAARARGWVSTPETLESPPAGSGPAGASMDRNPDRDPGPQDTQPGQPSNMAARGRRP